MGYINKKNKVGAVAENAAPYLQEGELGIDLNAANGDVGRVYVGTGNQNVALAKKAEVDSLNTLKAPLESPALTGVPTGPTAAVGTSTTQLATTAFVQAEIANDTYSKTQLDAGQLDNRYYTETELNAINVFRADKYLAAQNIAAMLYDVDGNLSKIQYNNAADVDYEVLEYVSGNLSAIQHYVGNVLKGTTTLSYTSGNLVSAIFVGV